MEPQVLYLIYDGECPLCRNVAKHLRVRKSVGQLEIINAREKHPLAQEMNAKGYDLNKGILVQYGAQIYYGQEAVHFLAMVGSPLDLFNRINAFLFKSRKISRIIYPCLKTFRSLLLFILKIPKIPDESQKPIFEAIFGETWSALPLSIKKHYGNRPYSTDCVTCVGFMDITLSRFTKALAPLLKFFGVLAPYEGKNIPTTVYLKSEENSNHYILERHFQFPNGTPYIFRSKFVPLKGSEVIEVMKYGIGWRCIYHWDGSKIRLLQKGYAWYFRGLCVPLPLQIIFGNCTVEQESKDDAHFTVQVLVSHSLFGKTLEYKGEFALT